MKMTEQHAIDLGFELVNEEKDFAAGHLVQYQKGAILLDYFYPHKTGKLSIMANIQTVSLTDPTELAVLDLILNKPNNINAENETPLKCQHEYVLMGGDMVCKKKGCDKRWVAV